MAYEKNSHCGYCGRAFEDPSWPRTCLGCGNRTHRNPLPVAVLIVPADDGPLAVRCGVEPRRGLLALPGGYIGHGESWQAAGAREVFEETGVTVDPATVQDFRVLSAPDGTVLIFGLAERQSAADWPAFEPGREVSERVLLTEPQELAFPLHTRVLGEYFNRHAAGRP